MKYFPQKISIFIGSHDPLRDDCIRMTDNFIKAGKNVNLTEFKYLPHGFLGYDMSGVTPEISVTYEYIMNEIEKLFE